MHGGFTIHPGELRRFTVLVSGPRAEHGVSVFAISPGAAAEAAIEKVKDKIRRGRWQRSWAGRIRDPWLVRKVVEN